MKTLLLLALSVTSVLFGAERRDPAAADGASGAHPQRVFPPTVDLSADTARQVVVAAGTPTVYQGHPTTVMLPDGKTMYCVWTIGHGGPAGPMKRSDDGGRTWSPLHEVPANWTSVRNCPAIYRLTDPEGRARLIVYAGEGPDGAMAEAESLDDGRSWTPMRSNGLTAVMPFCTIVPIDGGKRLLGMSNTRRPGETKENRSNVVTQSISADGGLTWTPWRVVVDLPGLKPCEPCLVRSPDGRELLCLIRENVKRVALYMTSRDEGKTWSPTKPLPPGLFGDRHVARYAPDGRLVVCFRDTGGLYGSPTSTHYVAWVGRYEDITSGRDGQYRVKLLHSYHGGDCGYSGVDVLPDGTFVATTYIKYRPGPELNSVVSTRFTLAETDAMAPVGGAAGGFPFEMNPHLEPTRRVVYKQVAGQELHLDIFERTRHVATDRRAAFVAIHGGGWSGGNPRLMYAWADHAASLGMVGISVEYRRYRPQSPNTVFACVEDARSAVRYVRAHAAELGIDPTRIVVNGASAGGHLALGTALFDAVNSSGEDVTISCRPDALVLFSPVVDTSVGAGPIKIGERWRELSPVDHVRSGMPPTITFQGTGDALTPFAAAQRFQEAMVRGGNASELVIAPGAQHTYMFKDAALYAQTVRQLDAFFERHGFIAASAR